MPFVKIDIPVKNRPVDTQKIVIRGWGVPSPTVQIYLYADVLEELFFRATTQPDASCLLTGGWFLDREGNEFIEVDSFRDMVPVENSLGYAAYFIKNGSAMKPYPGECILGCCHLRKGSHAKASAEDVIFHNSYFNYGYHVTLLIDGENDEFCAYQIGKDQQFCDTGVFLISAVSPSVPPSAEP